MQKGMTFTFNIVNLLKVDSLYNEGLKPCVYSCKAHQIYGTKWTRSGTNISYKKNPSNTVEILTKGVSFAFYLKFGFL